jgi:predicted nucleotidyltransferase
VSVTYGVRSLALFGSLARHEATDQSDVDLLYRSSSDC